MYSSKRIEEKYLTPGIHEGVSLVSYRYDKSPAGGNKFIEFVFEKDGMKVTHTEWEPKEPLNLDKKLTAEEMAKILQDKVDSLGKKIDQILACFIPNKEDRTYTAESFAEYAKYVIDSLDKADKNKLLRVKFVYNKSNYVALPQFGKIPFIELMDINKEASKLKINPKYDKMTKDIVADTESPNTNTISQESSENRERTVDDLPF